MAAKTSGTDSLLPITALPIDALIPDADNPRLMSDGAMQRLYGSIDEYGFLQPIVVNERDGQYIVVSGHQRLSVLKMRGESSAPCVIVHWDEHKEAAANIAFNAQYGTFDDIKLAEILHELDEAQYDLDLTALEPFRLEEIMQAAQDIINDTPPVEATDNTGMSPDPTSPGNPGEDRYKEQFGVIVICTSEAHQEEVYTSLLGSGYNCRVVVT